MSEPSNAQPAAPAPALDERPEPASSLRIDRPHVPAAGESGAEAARQSAFPARNVPVHAASGIDVRLISSLDAGPAGGPQESDHYALETEQIAAHLRQQYADLDRREQLLHAQLAQLDQERREQRMWAGELEVGLQEREFAIARQEAALAQRADSCVKLETELKELHEALLRERHSLNAERDQLTQDREDQTRSLEALQARQHQELERLRADLAAEHEQAETELKQQRILFDNRHRFQQDHLQRTMHEFEKVQDDFRREQQLSRTRQEETQAQNLLRSRQLDRQRDLLDDRQRSIEREREVLLKERRALEGRVAADAEELRRERAAWESDRDSQKADLRRQQDMLALHAENLETRRQRLDRLRAEMEETNRQTLELRLAVEEASAQLTQSAGAEVTKRRIDEARAILAEYYRHTRESLIQQRQELEQAQLRVHQQREEFRAERQSLVEWVGQQETQLAAREKESIRQRDAMDQRESAWRAAAERWTNEKLEAETVIRDLLKRLGERDR
ncbi:MAG: hypothetical protein ACM3U2_24145 [Deltaproteobacteria bacterium]